MRRSERTATSNIPWFCAGRSVLPNLTSRPAEQDGELPGLSFECSWFRRAAMANELDCQLVMPQTRPWRLRAAAGRRVSGDSERSTVARFGGQCQPKRHPSHLADAGGRVCRRSDNRACEQRRLGRRFAGDPRVPLIARHLYVPESPRTRGQVWLARRWCGAVQAAPTGPQEPRSLRRMGSPPTPFPGHR